MPFLPFPEWEPDVFDFPCGGNWCRCRNRVLKRFRKMTGGPPGGLMISGPLFIGLARCCWRRPR